MKNSAHSHGTCARGRCVNSAVKTLLAALALLFLLAAARPAQAQGKTLYWDRYDVAITIQPDGTLRVVETQQITFTSGTFTFGFAAIPLDKTEGISEISVQEGDRLYRRSSSQQPYSFDVESFGEGIDIRWYFPETGDSTHTYELAYTVAGAVRIYDTGDKLQWIAISGERDFPIQEATVTVNLPAGAQFRTIDSAGVRAQYQENAQANSVTYVAQDILYGSDTLEVGAEFTHGVVPAVKPAWQVQVDQDEFYDLRVRPVLNLLLGGLGVLLAVGAPAAVYLLWFLRGRDPEVGPIPEYLSEPPSDLPPGVIGSLVDESADMKDVVASLVDLARRGYIEMEEVQTKGSFGIKETDHTFRKLKDDGDLTKFERDLMKGVFGSESEKKLTGLRQKFYVHLPKIQADLYDELIRRKFFARSPQKTRSAYTGAGGVLLFLSLIGGFFIIAAAGQFAEAIFCPLAGFAIFSVALMIAGPRMPAKTRAGAEEAAKWNAFKEYLRRIETLTDLKSAAGLFDRYLPYAIAFGLEQSWVSKFSKVVTTPIPGWYIPYPYGGYGGVPAGRRGLASPALGHGTAVPGSPGSAPGLQGMSDNLAGGLQSMSNGLTNMLNSAGRTLGSVPQSSGGGRSGWSGGGGFSSGGFSGGGGGGGGGRGFG